MFPKLIRLICGVSAVVVLAHVAWSLLIAEAFKQIYDHRPPEIRELDNSQGKDWEPILTAFWQANLSRRPRAPATVFIGSSMTYGYPWQESIIFSRVYSELVPHENVINLSVIGADISGIDQYLLCPLRGSPKAPDTVIVEIPLVNTVSTITKPQTGVPRSKRTCTKMYNSWEGRYFGFVVRRPIGIGWIALLWDSEAYFKPDEVLQVVKVPKGYFASEQDFERNKTEYQKEIALFLKKTAQLGNKVYVFISPIYLPAIAEVGGDRVAVEKQIQVTFEVCKSVKDVTCLNTTRFSEDRSLFYNITHFNQQGHRAFGEWLAQEVSNSGLATHQHSVVR